MASTSLRWFSHRNATLRLALAGIALVTLVAAGCRPAAKGTKLPADAKSSGGLHAVIETDQGAIEIEFFPGEAPKAVENFRLLAEHGYYNGVTFHRIVKGFMLQGGDPEGTGRGGESAWGGTFADEIKPDSALYQGGYKRGLVAMANAGPNTNGSQFFIMHHDYPLPPAYVIFAKVTKGMDVVDTLADVPVKLGPDGGMSQPLTPPTMKTVTVKP
jgi:cyclophilin family peptidyl-prolyl cis-trans isomerase